MTSIFLTCATVGQTVFAQEGSGYQCNAQDERIFDAVRGGDYDALKAHVEVQCALPKEDGRGFTLYDLAALNGDESMMQWLVGQGYAVENQYSRAMLKLVQTGLRFLNFDAGVIDGNMNDETAIGIRDFQQANNFAQTGTINAEWLAQFRRSLTRKMQIKLSELGFSSGSADGIIGPNTRSAMQAFRLERSMPETDYAYIDDQLIYQLMMAENEAQKLEIARREAERAARIVAQQAAQREEIARQRALAQERAEAQARQAEAAARQAEEQRIAEEQTLRTEQERAAQVLALAEQQRAEKFAQEQAAIAEQQALAESQRQEEAQALQAQIEQAAQAQRELEAEIAKLEAQRAAEEAQLAAQAAALEAQQKAEQEAEQESIRQAEMQAARLAEQRRQAEALAAQQAEEAKRAEEAARAEAEAAQKAADEARVLAQEAFKAARSGEAVALSPDVQVGRPVANQTTTTSPTNLGGSSSGFNELSGKLQFIQSGGELSQCLIGGQAIDTTWCEMYYPSGENKQCDAIISKTGIVVSLLCQ